MIQLNLNVHAEIVVDNFAGGGGASHGIEAAIGRRIDVAINHDPETIAMHRAKRVVGLVQIGQGVFIDAERMALPIDIEIEAHVTADRCHIERPAVVWHGSHPQ